MANLEFKEYFENGNPTHFKEMIQAALYAHGDERVRAELIHLFDYKHKPGVQHKELTLRNDTKRRWHTGKSIHFVMGGVQFAPAVPAEVKFLKVRFTDRKIELYLDDWRLSERNVSSLVRHDGFDDRQAFFEYHFDTRKSNEFFKTLIFWTKLKL